MKLNLKNIDQHIANAEVQEGLLHLYNWTKEQGGYLLITASERPKNWNISLDDLSSRMLASETVEIKAPDDYLLEAVIIKQFSDRQITLPADVISYLIPRAERSFDAIRKLVQNIDKLSRIEKKKITIPIARRVLEADDEG